MKLGKRVLLTFGLAAWIMGTTPMTQAKPLAVELDQLMQATTTTNTPSPFQQHSLKGFKTVTVDSRTPTETVSPAWKEHEKLVAAYSLYDAPFSLFAKQDASQLQNTQFGQPVTETQRRIFQGIQAYLNLILQKKMVEIARTNVMQVEEVQNYIASEIRNGHPYQDEYTQAATRLEQAHRILKAYQKNLAKGEATYRATFQHTADLMTMMDPSFSQEIMPENVEEAVRLARLHHPVLQEISHKRKQWDKNAKSAMFLSMNVEERVRNAYGVITSERTHLQELAQAEKQANRTFNKSYEMMSAGNAGIIDALDSALSLMDIRIAITASDYAHRLANYQLLLATGQMSAQTTANLIVDQKLNLAQLHTVHLNTAQPSTIEPDYDKMAAIDLPSGETGEYNDLAAFESAYGAPYSAELAPEPSMSNPIEIAAQKSTGYYLVLGSFSQQTGAYDRIQLAGMDNAFTKHVEVNGKAFSRVLVGPMSQQEAKKTKQLADKRGITDSWILFE